MGKGYVFLKPSGANGRGHVGWAFQEPATGDYIGGSTENPSGAPNIAASLKGYWAFKITANQLLNFFVTSHQLDDGNKTSSYLKYKCFEIANPDFNQAWATACWVKEQDYAVTGIPRGRNCMDDAYDILVAYGANWLPWPTTHPVPNNWFDSIPYPANGILTDPLARSIEKIELIKPEIVKGVMPVWRDATTVEGEAFNRE